LQAKTRYGLANTSPRTPNVQSELILLVEREARSRRLLKVSLEQAGYAVDVASDAFEALAQLEHRAPALVVSATELPRLDGHALVRRMKDSEAWAHIPVIFISASHSIEDKIRALELGVDDYLHKPVFVQELLGRVQVILAKRTRHDLSESAAETRVRGSLRDMAPIDLLESLEEGKQSGVVRLGKSTGGEIGELWFSSGEIVHARLKRLRGEEAVFRMLGWLDGRYEVELGVESDERTIETGTRSVIDAGLRHLSEYHRLLTQLPPAHAPLEVDGAKLVVRQSEIPDEINGILELVDGERCIADLLDESPFDDLSTLATVLKLCVEGLIVVAPESETPAEVAPDAAGDDDELIYRVDTSRPPPVMANTSEAPPLSSEMPATPSTRVVIARQPSSEDIHEVPTRPTPLHPPPTRDVAKHEDIDTRGWSDDLVPGGEFPAPLESDAGEDGDEAREPSVAEPPPAPAGKGTGLYGSFGSGVRAAAAERLIRESYPARQGPKARADRADDASLAPPTVVGHRGAVAAQEAAGVEPPRSEPRHQPEDHGQDTPGQDTPGQDTRPARSDVVAPVADEQPLAAVLVSPPFRDVGLRPAVRARGSNGANGGGARLEHTPDERQNAVSTMPAADAIAAAEAFEESEEIEPESDDALGTTVESRFDGIELAPAPSARDDDAGGGVEPETGALLAASERELSESGVSNEFFSRPPEEVVVDEPPVSSRDEPVFLNHGQVQRKETGKRVVAVVVAIFAAGILYAMVFGRSSASDETKGATPSAGASVAPSAPASVAAPAPEPPPVAPAAPSASSAEEGKGGAPPADETLVDVPDPLERASALLNVGNYKDSIPFSKAAIAKEPDNGDGYFFLGQAYEALGQGADAKKAYESCVAHGKKGKHLHWCKSLAR
jgi:CheY-like chemotaxis protein